MGKTRCKFAGFVIWLTLVMVANGSKSHVYKTIETDNGDVYECIDVHKQPSLEHPALKEHKVQMRPSSLVGRQLLKKQEETSDHVGQSKIWLKEGCPLGSVPILKHVPRSLAKPKRMLASQNFTQPLQDSPNGIFFSGLATKGSQQIAGASGFYSIYNPKLTGPDQRSSAILVLESRNGGSYSRVEAGWTVNPKLYGDSNTRLYTFWTTDESRSTGCFNTDCPGFVHISEAKPLGFPFPSISIPRKQFFDAGIQIAKDSEGVYLNVDGGDIGYWPYDIVPNMKDGPLEVKWGGEVFMPDTRIAYPQMGSGNFNRRKRFSFAVDAYVDGVLMLDENLGNIIPSDATVQLSMCTCYLVGGNEFRDARQYSFVYGGGGGVPGQDCPP